MQRRSALGHLAATLAGLSLGDVPGLEAAARHPNEAFSVTPANLPESSGMASCPVCHEMGDALSLTPAGLCLRCADQRPNLRVEPHSDGFWLLSPQQIRRLEGEIARIAAELTRMNQQLVELGQRQLTASGDDYNRAVEAKRPQWQAMQRELHLLHLLRAASRQFGS
jgi:hypothetical protein